MRVLLRNWVTGTTASRPQGALLPSLRETVWKLPCCLLASWIFHSDIGFKVRPRSGRSEWQQRSFHENLLFSPKELLLSSKAAHPIWAPEQKHDISAGRKICPNYHLVMLRFTGATIATTLAIDHLKHTKLDKTAQLNFPKTTWLSWILWSQRLGLFPTPIQPV